ncbi:MAG: nucleoside 2-deoxyribosyltransferase [Anaerolineaceae bacterium]|jgi:nucleoside 2-deoxyribosyltransferase
MNIYFSCSITGGRNEERTYQKIVQTLEEEGHFVPTAHLSTPQVMELENIVDPVDTYLRDMKWLHEADAVVAEASTPSHGVGYELATALNLNKPVFCAYHREKRISKIITGNTSPTLLLAPYSSDEEVISLLRQFLAQLRT